MSDNIETLRVVGNNLTPHLIMEGKTKIKKPQAVIPGATPDSDVNVILETKENKANLTVQKGNSEIQRATFDYDETPNGYKLVSAMSSYCQDDKVSKEFRQNHYLIEPEHEKSYEHYINYANAPLRDSTYDYINKINSSFATASGYKSSKTDYDSLESHTYGKKSLKRDIPALLKVVDVIAPDSEVTLKMKDKLKKDNKTSLVAFEVNDTTTGNGIARGFMSTDGDSVSYHIDTEKMVLIGEQSQDKDISKAYLKHEKAGDEQEIIKDGIKKELPDDTSVSKPVIPVAADEVPSAPVKRRGRKPKPKVIVETPEGEKKIYSEQVTESATKKEIKKGRPVSVAKPEIQIITNGENHVNSKEYYTDLLFEAAISEDIPKRAKIDIYKTTLATAYMDGYDKYDLYNIISGNGLLNFSKNCQETYVKDGISLAKTGTINRPVKSLESKIEDLKNAEINTDDWELKMCLLSMIGEVAKMEDRLFKESFADRTLSLLGNSESKNFKTDLLSFIQECSEENDDLKLHYEIYEETVNNKSVVDLRSHIMQMINNIDDANNYGKRDEYLTRLYGTADKQELKELQKEIQVLLNEQFDKSEVEEAPVLEEVRKLSIDDLSKANRKLVRDLLNCKSPRRMSMTFDSVCNLLKDIGFEEDNVNGTHHKFNAPIEIVLNGKKQSFVTVARGSEKTVSAAQIDDLINICKQLYGTEE